MAAACLLPLFVSACSAENSEQTDAHVWQPDEFRQWKLPGRLREISGLALTPDDRLLAVTDERAIVYELDYRLGGIVKSFALGDPVVLGDFEGIAVLDDTIWLMTSDGFLLAAKEAADGQSVRYKKYDTGHGDYCELEGLGQDRATNTLILVCKETHAKKSDLMIFEWTASSGGIEYLRKLPLPEAAIRDELDEKRLNPSGIAVDPQTGERVVIASRQAALVRMTAGGGLAAAIILKKKGRHHQAEGIEITQDGRMLIADEGGNGRARLAVYPAVSPGYKSNE